MIPTVDELNGVKQDTIHWPAKSNRVTQIDSDGNETDVQNPFPSDGDSVYYKDLDLDNCTAAGFDFDIGTGTEIEVIKDMVSSVFIGKSNASSDAIKTIYLEFKRPILTQSFGINSGPGKYFSNTKITLGQGDFTWIGCDCSANNTKNQIYLFPIEPVKFSSMKIEFYTTDEISIGLIGIFKNIEVAARIQALKPDGTVTDIGATTGGNLKVSVEEFDPAANPVRTNLEGGGKVSVGITAVEVTFTGTTTKILISADQTNTGLLFIGKSNVTNIGANAITFLLPGESIELDYNDSTNALYVVSDTASQYFWKGAML